MSESVASMVRDLKYVIGMINSTLHRIEDVMKDRRDNETNVHQDLKHEHDGCQGCKYESLSETEDPCKRCKQNYKDLYRFRERATNWDIAKEKGPKWLVRNLFGMCSDDKIDCNDECIECNIRWLNSPADGGAE